MTRLERRSVRNVAGAAALALCSLAPAHAQDRLYTDEELLGEGETAYRGADCPRATRFLFAYQQRNPAAMQASQIHRANVRRALENCAGYVLGATPGGRYVYSTGGGGEGALPTVDLRTGGGEMANGRCDIYARIAISQHEANLAQRCGYSDSRWHAGYRYHYDWCIGTPSATTRHETAERQAQLDRCRP